MSTLLQAARDGRAAAGRRFKVAFPAATHPVVKGSPVLTSAPGVDPGQVIPPPINQDTLARVFNVHEQGKTRIEPLKKVADALCGTCRKEKHYGPCLKPLRTHGAGVPHKEAGFNPGLTADDPSVSSGDGGPSHSAHYNPATSAVSSLARAPDGRPADEQAGTYFADLFRHLGITSAADQSLNNSGALAKVAIFPIPGTAVHSPTERRGPTVNIYEEGFPPRKSPIVGWGDEGTQRITRAFDQIDGAVDSTNIEGGGQPPTGPAVLG